MLSTSRQEDHLRSPRACQRSAPGLPTAYQTPSGSGHLALSEATARRSRTTSALDAASNDRAAARVARAAWQSASAIADASRMAFSFVRAALSLARLAVERACDSTVRSIWIASWSCAVMHAPSFDCPSCSADTGPQRDSPEIDQMQMLGGGVMIGASGTAGEQRECASEFKRGATHPLRATA